LDGPTKRNRILAFFLAALIPVLIVYFLPKYAAINNKNAPISKFVLSTVDEPPTVTLFEISENSEFLEPTELSEPLIEEAGIEIIVNRATPLLTEPATGEIILVIDENAILYLHETENPMWLLAETESGETGYIFTADFSYPNIVGLPKKITVQDEEITERLVHLQTLLPSGKYWNRHGTDIAYGVETPLSVTDIPCNHADDGELYCNIYNSNNGLVFPEFENICQCLAFAGYLSDNLFGEELPLYYLESFDDLRIGDHIRLTYYDHSMIITEKNKDTITVAEVNENYANCLISWERKLTKEDLASYGYGGVQYISRYPKLEFKDKIYYFNDIKLNFVNE